MGRNGLRVRDRNKTDAIRICQTAVPHKEPGGYWGYVRIPKKGYLRWTRLPNLARHPATAS